MGLVLYVTEKGGESGSDEAGPAVTRSKATGPTPESGEGVPQPKGRVPADLPLRAAPELCRPRRTGIISGQRERPLVVAGWPGDLRRDGHPEGRRGGDLVGTTPRTRLPLHGQAAPRPWTARRRLHRWTDDVPRPCRASGTPPGDAIHVATRRSTDEAFGRPQEVAELRSVPVPPEPLPLDRRIVAVFQPDAGQRRRALVRHPGLDTIEVGAAPTGGGDVARRR